MRLLLFVGLGYFRDEDSYEFGKASQTIDIETEVQPYMIDDLNDKVTAAVSTVGSGILDLMGQQGCANIIGSHSIKSCLKSYILAICELFVEKISV